MACIQAVSQKKLEKTLEKIKNKLNMDITSLFCSWYYSPEITTSLPLSHTDWDAPSFLLSSLSSHIKRRLLEMLLVSWKKQLWEQHRCLPATWWAMELRLGSCEACLLSSIVWDEWKRAPQWSIGQWWRKSRKAMWPFKTGIEELLDEQ